MAARLQPFYRGFAARPPISVSICVSVPTEATAGHHRALPGQIVIERQLVRALAAPHSLNQVESTTSPDQRLGALTKPSLNSMSSRRMYGETEIVFTTVHPGRRACPLRQALTPEQAAWKRWSPVMPTSSSGSKHRSSYCPRPMTVTAASVKGRGGCRLAMPRVE